MLRLALIAVCLAVARAAPAAPNDHPKAPANVQLCYRDKPDFHECLRDSIQDLFPRLARGLTDLDIPPIDPMHVEESFYESVTPMYSGKTSVKDAYVYGLSSAKFSKFTTKFDDPNNIELEAEMHVDRSRVEGNFKYHGKVMNFPLTGKGPFNITGDDYTINWKLVGSLYNKEGERYLKIRTFVITPKFGDMLIEAKNLIEGNPQLSQTLVSMFNQYWRVGVEIGLPFVQEGWEKVFKPIPNRVFEKVPFDVLFPTSQ